MKTRAEQFFFQKLFISSYILIVEHMSFLKLLIFIYIS